MTWRWGVEGRRVVDIESVVDRSQEQQPAHWTAPAQTTSASSRPNLTRQQLQYTFYHRLGCLMRV